MKLNVSLRALIEPARVIRAGDDDLPILSMTMRDGLVDQADKFKKRVASENTSSYKRVRRNQLVVGFPIDEGVLAFQKRYDEAIVSPAYDVWNVCDKNKVLPAYLERVLKSERSLSYYRAKLQGTTARRRTLPDDIFLELKIPLPSFEEQKRIAAILDKADSLRRKRQQAIQLADDFLRATFLDMFGDPVTNPKQWPTVELDSLILNGPTNGLYRPASDYVDSDSSEGVPILRIDGFYDGKLANGYKFKRLNIDQIIVEKYLLRKNSIVINRVNSKEYVGKAMLVPDLQEPTVYESNMMNFSVDSSKVCPLFLVEQLSDPFVRGQIASMRKDAVNQSSINQGDVRSIRIRLPCLNLQEKYTALARRIDVIKEGYMHALDKNAKLVSGLQTTLFAV